MNPRSLNRLVAGLGIAALAAVGCSGAATGESSATKPSSQPSATGTDFERATVRVGLGPFLSFGGFWVAQEKGYFDDVGLDVEVTSYVDGSLIVPPLIAGDLDIGGLTMAANTFNSVAKGAPFKLVLDGGQEREGTGSVALNVSKAIAAEGVTTISDLRALAGKKVGVAAVGSINQYMTAKALEAAGLDPRSDVEWVTGMGQPDLVKVFGQGQLDAVNLAVQFAAAAESQGFGPVVVRGYEAAPLMQVTTLAMRTDFLTERRDVATRFAAAYLQGIRDYNAAQEAPQDHADELAMLAKHTVLDTPEKLLDLHPWWPWVEPNGMPNSTSIMEQQDYWADYFTMVEEKADAEQLLDLKLAQEARTLLESRPLFAESK